MIKTGAEKFSNKEITHLLRSIAAVYLLTGVNRFRIIAYEKAADSIEHLTREVKDIWQEGKLFAIPGIGSSIGSYLEEYFKTGKSKHFNSVLSKIPETVFILMKIPTIGPKKAFKLVNELKLLNLETVVDDLNKACLDGKVAKLETFGEKSQKEILEAVDLYIRRSSKTERMPLPYAGEIAKDIINYLKKNQNIARVDALGSLRRMVATIGDIDIAVQIRNPKSEIRNNEKKVIDYFIGYPKKIRIDNAGKRKASIIVHPNIRIDLRVQDEKSYGSMLQYFTGNKAHNINLREFALKKGLSLSEYGIKHIKKSNLNQSKHGSELSRTDLRSGTGAKIYEFNNEEKFYNFLGLQHIPPEIREGTNEIDLAAKNQIPKLIETKEIKGDLHVHSSYDLKPAHDLGKNSYRKILKKADELNYQYVGFADHNPKISALSAEEITAIMKRRKEYIINTCSGEKKIKFFIGLEADILSDGKIALPPAAIEFVDYLIVSVHSVFNLNMEDMTKRVLRALDFPKVKILGHPTGRLLGKREGFELEWKKIFELCRKKNIALEINSWPERLDLPDTLVREALNQEVKFAINTDAHANYQMDGIFYGTAVARRGWCKKSDIINTLDYLDFKKWLQS